MSNTTIQKELRAWALMDITPEDLKSVLVAAADKLDVAEGLLESARGETVDLGSFVQDPTDKAAVEASPGGPDYQDPEPVSSWYARLESAKIGSTLVQTRGAGPFGPKTYVKGSYELWYAESDGANIGMPSYSFSPGAYRLEERV